MLRAPTLLREQGGLVARVNQHRTAAPQLETCKIGSGYPSEDRPRRFKMHACVCIMHIYIIYYNLYVFT